MNWTQEQYDDYLRSRKVDAPPQVVKRSNAPSRPRHTPGEMNKTEAAYEIQLKCEKLAGVIVWYAFESIKLRLAGRTWYTPDFTVIYADGRIGFREVKGFLREDASVKWKVAAEMFPFAEFIMIRRKSTGTWEEMRRSNGR
jgi:hypothetical protein